jgi:hypothetical protein
MDIFSISTTIELGKLKNFHHHTLRNTWKKMGVVGKTIYGGARALELSSTYTSYASKYPLIWFTRARIRFCSAALFRYDFLDAMSSTIRNP